MLTKLLARVAWSTTPTLSLKELLESLISRIGNLEVSNQRIGRGAIGEAFFYDGLIPPTGALIADTSAIPRATYPQLMDALAPVLTCVITNGSTQVTGVSANIIAQLGGAGAKSPQIPVEGVGLPVGCKIASIAGTTITLSAAATSAGTSIRIFIHGNGDGNTTYNLPEGRAEFWRGVDLGRGVDTGRVLGAAQGQTTQQHNHGLDVRIDNSAMLINGAGNAIPQGVVVGGTTGASITPTQMAFSGNTETRPRNVAKLPCIWAL